MHCTSNTWKPSTFLRKKGNTVNFIYVVNSKQETKNSDIDDWTG